MEKEKDKLSQLKTMTKVVIDTGDFESIKKYTPIDATTNPSLIYAAAQKPEYQDLLKEAVAYSQSKAKSTSEQTKLLIDKLFVNFGIEILKIISGRVSTEVDARLSFDSEGSVQKARDLIKLYEQAGVSRDRILIKLASTWEGIKAGHQLEKEGIHVNMTLMFSLAQAIGSAQAKVTLISPFVGRILDWYKKSENKEGYPAAEDPGVKSVTDIYYFLKKYGYSTQVMGASFRNSEEILELAGCDLLTIAPQFLEELQQAKGDVLRKLSPSQAVKVEASNEQLDEKTFRWMLNENAMATEKLAEGIRNFTKDTVKLEKYLKDKFTH